MSGRRRKAANGLALALAAAVLGCGGGGVKPAAAVVDVPRGVASATTDGARVPTKALRDAFVAKSAGGFLYVDVDALARAQVSGALLAQLDTVAEGAMAPPMRACLATFLASTKEVAVSDRLMVARVDPAAEARLAACVPVIVPEAEKTTVKGVPAAWRAREVIALGRGLLVAGPIEGMVVAAFEGPPSAGSPLEGVRLGADEVAAFGGPLDFRGLRGSLRGKLLASSERLRIGVTAKLEEQVAQELASALTPATLARGAEELLGRGADPAAQRLVERILAGFSVTAREGTLDLALEVAGMPNEQAEVVGGAAAVGVFAVRRYIATAKTAEAKNTVGQLARDLVAAWEREYLPGDDPFRPRLGSGKGRARQLVSFPAVPRDIPRGTKFQSSAADWKPWAPLKFEMTSPQYYQYEVVAAKDGQSAEIIARGDLDGNGKPSTFKLRVAVKGAFLQLAPGLEEIDPFE